MEVSVAGFKKTGDWITIVEHAERITYALRVAGTSKSRTEFQEWDEWRPKIEDKEVDDVKQRTAEQAASGEEEDLEIAKENIDDTTEKISETSEEIQNGKVKNTLLSLSESFQKLSAAIKHGFRRFFRAVEMPIYENVMTAISPQYFDNELISANLNENSTYKTDNTEYTLEVNINDDSLKSEVKDVLEHFESEIQRWHSNTEVDTEAAEMTEGIDVPESPELEHPSVVIQKQLPGEKMD